MQLTIIPVGMLGTNCYLLASAEGGCAVVDPGSQPDKIADVIEEKKLTPKYILLTHGHHDHIGGVKKLCGRYPDAALYIGEKDAEMLTDETKSYAMDRGLSKDDAIFDRIDTVKEGDTLALDELTIRVLETPGHTRGGVTYLCGEVMFSGDTLFAGDVGRTDLYGGDYDVLKASLRKLRALPGDYQVYPGHGPASTLERERVGNPYMNE